MRKFVLIFLLSILIFNWIGYQLYIAIMEHHADRAMIAKLNSNDYSETDLVSIKVPVGYLYYYAGSTGFERIDGKVEIRGVQYNYVKRRFFNDSLELLCLPNKIATQLKTAKEDFYTLVNDLQHDGRSKEKDRHATALKSLNGNYYAHINQFDLPANQVFVIVMKDHYLMYFPSVYLGRSTPPPDLIA
jgi:hypothetical protein